MDQKLQQILESTVNGQRLSDEDALYLFESPDLLTIGDYANQVNLKKNHDTVYYNINRHINPTNICALSCKFCAYSRKPGEEGAYAYDIDEMVQKAGEAIKQGATEIHMVGGLHPRWNFQKYLDIISAVKTAHPQVHVKASTAVEIDWMAKKARLSIPEVLTKLKEAGLDSMPGGGAEIFHPEIREQICDTKVPAEQWIDTHRTAHGMGLRSNATMLYGHIESFFHRVDHMRRVRELQDETGGFNVFIPLSFQPYENMMGINRYTYSTDDLKTIAIARLYLDNFKHVKAYWIMLGQETAQVGLHFGANDLDGTVTEEKISRMAGGQSGMVMSVGEIQNLITNAGKNPRERDTLYRPIIRNAPNDTPAVDTAISKDTVAASDHNFDVEHHGNDIQDHQIWALSLLKRFNLNQLGRIANKQKSTLKTKSFGSFSSVHRVFVAEYASTSALSSDLLTYLQELEFQGKAGTIILDCTNQKDELKANLADAVVSVKSLYPQTLVGIEGVKELIYLSHNKGMALESLLKQFSEAGVSYCGSSPYEHENGLQLKDILHFHQLVNNADMISSAKVALTLDEQHQPLWNEFVEKVIALNQYASRKKGLVSLSLCAAQQDITATAVDFLKAIALARILCDQIVNISTPIDGMPATARNVAINFKTDRHAPKITSLCLAYGANDLGLIDEKSVNILSVMEEIFAAGLTPQRRGLDHYRQDIDFTGDFDRMKRNHFPTLINTGAVADNLL